MLLFYPIMFTLLECFFMIVEMHKYTDFFDILFKIKHDRLYKVSIFSRFQSEKSRYSLSVNTGNMIRKIYSK